MLTQVDVPDKIPRSLGMAELELFSYIGTRSYASTAEKKFHLPKMCIWIQRYTFVPKGLAIHKSLLYNVFRHKQPYFFDVS